MTQWASRMPRALTEADAVRRPVHGEDLADQVPARNRAPLARVARLRAVVAHHEVLARRNRPLRVRGARVAAGALDVRLDQLLAVDVDEPVLLLPGLPGQGDQALD